MTSSANRSLISLLHRPAAELIRKHGPGVVEALVSSAALRTATLPQTRSMRLAQEMKPAALRLERSKDAFGAEQSALTVWFGKGPELPTTPRRAEHSGALRTGATILGTAVLSAAAIAFAEWDRNRSVITARARDVSPPLSRLDD